MRKDQAIERIFNLIENIEEDVRTLRELIQQVILEESSIGGNEILVDAEVIQEEEEQDKKPRAKPTRATKAEIIAEARKRAKTWAESEKKKTQARRSHGERK
jgi:hypothetical protein